MATLAYKNFVTELRSSSFIPNPQWVSEKFHENLGVTKIIKFIEITFNILLPVHLTDCELEIIKLHYIFSDAPLRVNGKITGKINGEKLVNLDLQSYIVMTDSRAYTAISKIPESIGTDIQSLQILGSSIGYLFAKPIRGAINGYQLTGGIFNYTAQLFFQNTNQSIAITQKYHGLDLFDQLRLEANIQGEIPNLPNGVKVIIDEYQEEYTITAPGIIQSSSNRVFKYQDENGTEIVHPYSVYQSFQFEECKYRNSSFGNSWKLKVGKNFISYEATEQIIRFGLSNKVTPIGGE